jgi:enoyl-[acyl-carrier protein] reductase I
MPLRRSDRTDELAQKTVPNHSCLCNIVADLEILVDKAVEALGGKIDFVLHSIGMSECSKNHYTSQNYDYTRKAGMYLRFLFTR